LAVAAGWRLEATQTISAGFMNDFSDAAFMAGVLRGRIRQRSSPLTGYFLIFGCLRMAFARVFRARQAGH
jgi:hypothetical protein